MRTVGAAETVPGNEFAVAQDRGWIGCLPIFKRNRWKLAGAEMPPGIRAVQISGLCPAGRDVMCFETFLVGLGHEN